MSRCALCTVVAMAAAETVQAQPSSPHIRIDQFGYQPQAKKIAVFREPVQGFDAPLPFSPGPLIQVRRISDQQVAFTAAPSTWNAGTVHTQSGDRVWRVDFSSLTAPGTYYIHDPTTSVSSEPFDIRDDVYDLALRQAVRMYYYQRCGIPKVVPFVPAGWSDATCHLGSQQDLDCRSVLNPVPSTSRDLSGGWHDAGNYGKYVNSSDKALHSLLFAYEDVPWYWTDDYGIPESGNGIPDLLDEIKWELNWLLKMQNPDGSVLYRVDVTDYSHASPPSMDGGLRRYAPATASATINACGAYAHAALVFASLPQTHAYAATLQTAAENAWNWLAANPGAIPSAYDNAGFGAVVPDESAYDQQTSRLCAAIYLFRLTGAATYRSYVDANYLSAHLFVWTYASVFEQEYNDALLLYADSPGATPSVAVLINYWYSDSVFVDHLPQVQNLVDPYGAFLEDQFHYWGCNRIRALQGQRYASMIRRGLGGANTEALRDAAEAYVHFFHGVNPLGFVFLTNMGAFGANSSVNETFHYWFFHGTVWDNATTSPFGPPPGYLTGGPNPQFAPGSSYTGPPLEPPQNQPMQKSYRDWNSPSPENSWSVTEGAIAYQAAYVRLLAQTYAACPECPGPVPTVSAWGVTVLALLVLSSGSLILRRRGGTSAGWSSHARRRSAVLSTTTLCTFVREFSQTSNEACRQARTAFEATPKVGPRRSATSCSDRADRPEQLRPSFASNRCRTQ